MSSLTLNITKRDFNKLSPNGNKDFFNRNKWNTSNSSTRRRVLTTDNIPMLLRVIKNTEKSKEFLYKLLRNHYVPTLKKYATNPNTLEKRYANALQNIINKENDTKQNFSINRKNGRVYLYYKPNSTRRTYVYSVINTPNKFNISFGRTNAPFRNKGIGKQMRALMTLAAKRAGFKKVTQQSIFIEKNQVKTHKNPPSSYIMKSLGFDQDSRGGGVINHVYVFNNKSNNNRLVQAAYHRRIRPQRNSNKI